MVGGEFLNCSEEQVDDVENLLDQIVEKNQDLIDLSAAIQVLDDMLREHTSGESIEKFYKKIPDPLKGFIEIYVDMNHNPSYRFLESLIYQSKYYKKEIQSVSFGLINKVEERSFVFSTPRLPDEHHLLLDIDFNAPLIDRLFRSREIPLNGEEYNNLVDTVEGRGGLRIENLFSDDEPPRRYQPVQSGLRIQYIGHAGFMLETKDVSILIDPVIASRGETYADDVISYSELPPKIDYICITHNHQDHCNIETLLQLRYKTDKIIVPKNNGGTIVDPSMKLLLQQLNFNVIEVEDMEIINIDGGKIVSVPFLGEHGDLNIRSKSAWYFEMHGKKLYFGADSSNLDPTMYEHIHKVLGDVDILAIGMECVGAPYTWIYGALNTQKISKNIKNSRRLNGSDFEQAYKMVEVFQPKDVFVYALGREPWYKYFMGIEYDDDSKQIVESDKMVKACKENRINAESMYGKKTVIFD
jgi:L-ascorbate metabolism protein UlaG (beta-lactamase superfamily)